MAWTSVRGINLGCLGRKLLKPLKLQKALGGAEGGFKGLKGASKGLKGLKGASSP